MVTLSDCPCNTNKEKCTERTPTCHITCKRYLEWKAEWDKQKNDEYSQKQIEYMLKGVKKYD